MSPLLNRIFLMMIFSTQANADSICENGQLRSTTAGKTKIISSNYCYNSAKTILFSKSCEQNSCPAFAFPHALNFQEFIGPYGNPAFGVCRKVGGIPEILEFKAEEKWYKLDRCLFKDGSYVNSDFIAHYYFHLKD